MFHHLRTSQFTAAGERTAHFDGGPYQAGVSFFDVDVGLGEGPPLHLHSYPETWIIKNGQVEFTIDKTKTFGRLGDIIVVPAFTPHKFISCSQNRLQMICIHAASKIEQTNLEELEQSR
jgi:mannose-6-phosphate isomerase-like protein (cupin superfamily)